MLVRDWSGYRSVAFQLPTQHDPISDSEFLSQLQNYLTLPLLPAFSLGAFQYCQSGVYSTFSLTAVACDDWHAFDCSNCLHSSTLWDAVDFSELLHSVDCSWPPHAESIAPVVRAYCVSYHPVHFCASEHSVLFCSGYCFQPFCSGDWSDLPCSSEHFKLPLLLTARHCHSQAVVPTIIILQSFIMIMMTRIFPPLSPGFWDLVVHVPLHVIGSVLITGRWYLVTLIHICLIFLRQEDKMWFLFRLFFRCTFWHKCVFSCSLCSKGRAV